MSAHDTVSTAERKAHTGDWRVLVLVPLLALFLVHPLIVYGCSCGHDFDFHLLSWFEAATQISHGTLHPHWAYTAAWNAGEPRFVFYPPSSWYLGALLGLAFTHLPHISEASAWSAAPICFTWLALTLSGLTIFRLAHRFAGPSAALIAAAIYIANPYMLFTAFERTAYGELLAAAWIPLLFDGILRKQVSAIRIAVPVALLWLTNVPAAIMGSYALALLAALRFFLHAKDEPQIQNAIRCAAGTALGLGLAAFYVVPVALQRRYVQAATVITGGTRIDQNFLFEHTGTSLDDLMHDAVLRTASWIAVALLAAAAASLLAAWARTRTRTATAPVAILASFTAVVAFMLTSFSAVVWQYVPQLAYLQFPWRTLALLAPVPALMLACALPAKIKARSKSLPALAAFCIVALLGLPAWQLFHQFCDPEDTAPARIALFHSNAGTDPADYTPTNADNDALSHHNPAWWLADSPDAAAPAEADASATRTAPTNMAITASHAQFLVLNLRDYPSWRVTLAHDDAAPQIITARAHRADGLFAIPIPAGRSEINIRYAQTADQTAGDAITLIALGVAAALIARNKRMNSITAV